MQQALPRPILLVSAGPSRLQPFMEALARQSRSHIITVDSTAAAIDAVRKHKVALAVVDDPIGPESGLTLIRHLIQIDAFIQTAVVSDADEASFHDRSEGLGVLARLPSPPTADDAVRLWKIFMQINNLSP